MRSIPMTFDQVQSFSAQYKGDREHIVWNDGKLEVPDELFEEIVALDLSIPPPAVTGEDLASIKQSASEMVDKSAEEQRLRWITGGAGQAMTYQAKTQEAMDFLAAHARNEEVDPNRYPFLSAEIGISGKTLLDVANVVDFTHRQWAVLAAAIERIRLSSKSAITKAKSEAAVQAILDAITWPEAK